GDNTNVGAMWGAKRSGTTWTQQGNKKVGTGASGAARQGTSIAVNATGSTGLVGGPVDASNKGAAWIFVAPTSSLVSPDYDERSGETASVAGFVLSQNVPNPATDRTTIAFTLPEACSAEWQITDITGRVVFVLQREYPAGENTEQFDIAGYSGQFWYTLKTPFGVKTRNMTVIK
ncbi:MAG: hypothetical protein RL013_132, partial [Bacteroidota bacterium]